MREYKFRAWDNEANLMIYSDHRNRKLYDVCYYFETDSKGELKCNWEAEWTESCQPDGGAFNNLMQYAGLKDKNKIEIYENDIVKSKNFIGVVKHQLGSWLITFSKGRPIGLFTITFINNDVEVIGNIYENAEMVKEK